MHLCRYRDSTLVDSTMLLGSSTKLFCWRRKATIDAGRRFQVCNGWKCRSCVVRTISAALLEMFLVSNKVHIKKRRPNSFGARESSSHRPQVSTRCTGAVFIEIMRQPRGITHELQRMHDYGVLATYIREFGSVVGRMQYDLFHAYTVDQHSLFVVRNLRCFFVPERFHEFPRCSALVNRLPKPELLSRRSFS